MTVAEATPFQPLPVESPTAVPDVSSMCHTARKLLLQTAAGDWASVAAGLPYSIQMLSVFDEALMRGTLTQTWACCAVAFHDSIS